MTVAFQLHTVGRDGIPHTFDAELDHDPVAHTWSYRVPEPGGGDFYEARFVQVAGAVQPEVLTRNSATFRGKGVANALFVRVVADSAHQLVSSTNTGQKHFANESRSADAERIWRRLFGEERATYDAAQDRYTFVPQGTAKGPFGRAQPGRRPQFYVKGSYVLDHLFGTRFANDIDIHWLSAGGAVTAPAIRAWLDRCALLPHQTIHFDRVTDFFACDGGGPPIFNIDLWRIEMDGCVYQMDPGTHIATRIAAAPTVRLAFLPALPPCALTPNAATNAMLDKALRKMQQHPVLNDAGVAAEIARLKARPTP